MTPPLFDTEAMRYAAKLIEKMVDAGLFADDTLGSTGDWDPSVCYDEGYAAMCYTLSRQFFLLLQRPWPSQMPSGFPKSRKPTGKPITFEGTTNDCYEISRQLERYSKQDMIVALMDFPALRGLRRRRSQGWPQYHCGSEAE